MVEIVRQRETERVLSDIDKLRPMVLFHAIEGIYHGRALPDTSFKIDLISQQLISFISLHKKPPPLFCGSSDQQHLLADARAVKLQTINIESTCYGDAVLIPTIPYDLIRSSSKIFIRQILHLLSNNVIYR